MQDVSFCAQYNVLPLFLLYFLVGINFVYVLRVIKNCFISGRIWRICKYSVQHKSQQEFIELKNRSPLSAFKGHRENCDVCASAREIMLMMRIKAAGWDGFGYDVDPMGRLTSCWCAIVPNSSSSSSSLPHAVFFHRWAPCRAAGLAPSIWQWGSISVSVRPALWGRISVITLMAATSVASWHWQRFAANQLFGSKTVGLVVFGIGRNARVRNIKCFHLIMQI